MGAIISSDADFGIGAVDVVAADDDVFESLLFPLVANVFGEFVVALRSGDVGFGGEDAVLAAFFVGRGDGFEFCFDFGFVRGGGGGESEDWILRAQMRHERRAGRAMLCSMRLSERDVMVTGLNFESERSHRGFSPLSIRCCARRGT